LDPEEIMLQEVGKNLNNDKPYNQTDQVKEDEMGKAYSKYQGERECI
jgi:hypothetical protein